MIHNYTVNNEMDVIFVHIFLCQGVCVDVEVFGAGGVQISFCDIKPVPVGGFRLHTEPNGQTKVLQQSQRNMLVLQTLLSFGLALRIRHYTFYHFM